MERLGYSLNMAEGSSIESIVLEKIKAFLGIRNPFTQAIPKEDYSAHLAGKHVKTSLNTAGRVALAGITAAGSVGTPAAAEGLTKVASLVPTAVSDTMKSVGYKTESIITFPEPGIARGQTEGRRFTASGGKLGGSSLPQVDEIKVKVTNNPIPKPTDRPEPSGVWQRPAMPPEFTKTQSDFSPRNQANRPQINVKS